MTIRQSIAAKNRPSTLEEIAERIRYRHIASVVVNAEVKARYPVLTAENFAEADEYRQARLQELINQEG
jgi:hypothetical protein